MQYADFAAGMALLARCICPRGQYGFVLSVHTKDGVYFCHRLPMENLIIYQPLRGSAVALCKGRTAWQDDWPTPDGVVDVTPTHWSVYHKPQQAENHTAEEFSEAGGHDFGIIRITRPEHKVFNKPCPSITTDVSWLAAILSGLCEYHKSTYLECDFTYRHNTRRLVWTIGTKKILEMVDYDGTVQPRISVGQAIKADLERYLGRSWRFGGIRMTPMFPLVRPKPYSGWGR